MPDNNRTKEPKKKSGKLTRIDAQIDALLKERDTEVKRISQEEYKKDTRRKILLGQAMIKEATRTETIRKYIYNLLNKDLRRQYDRDVFDELMDGWGMPPLPPLVSSAPAPGGPGNEQEADEKIPEMEDGR